MAKVVIRGYGDLSFPTYPSYKVTVDEEKAIETIEEQYLYSYRDGKKY